MGIEPTDCDLRRNDDFAHVLNGTLIGTGIRVDPLGRKPGFTVEIRIRSRADVKKVIKVLREALGR